MNKQAQAHLAKAKEYVDRGEQFYRMAAEQISAAQTADSTLSNREIGERIGYSADWVRALVLWITNDEHLVTPTPFSAPGYAEKRAARMTKQTLRESSPEQIAELLDTPEARAKVTKALDTHYSAKARESATRNREREVDRKGGEDEHAAFEDRQRISELVSVVNGAASALRFAAGQAKALKLDEDDTGGADALNASLEEIIGFASMLREFLGGREITDEDIAALIGSGS